MLRPNSAVGSRLGPTALIAAFGLFFGWMLATWWFEGHRETFLRPTAGFDRIVFVVIANIVVGIVAAVWLARRWVEPSLDRPEASGLQLTARTFGWALLAWLLGGLLFILQGGSLPGPLVLMNTHAQVLPGSIAEVVVCWAVVGVAVEGRLQRRSRALAVAVAMLIASVAFGLYHFAHSPPFNTLSIVLLLTAVGFVTGAFFFATRDVVATVVLHNWLAVFGVSRALEAAGLIEHYRTPLAPQILSAVVAVCVALVVIGSRQLSRPSGAFASPQR